MDTYLAWLRIVAMGSALLLYGYAVEGRQLSENSPQIVQNPQGATTMQESLTALNGNAVNDISLTGSIVAKTTSANPESGSVLLVATSSGKSMTTITVPSGIYTDSRDYSGTTHTGTTTGPSGTQTLTVDDLMTPSPAWFSPHLLIASILSSQKYGSAFIGVENKGGATVNHLAIWSEPNGISRISSVAFQNTTQEDLYLDSTSSLPVSLVIKLRTSYQNTSIKYWNKTVLVPEEVQFSNYQSVQGVLIPFHIQVFIGKTLADDIQLSSAKVNSGVVITSN